MMTHEIRIDTNGTVTMVYSDELRLEMLGAALVRRASHVEPVEDGSGWTCTFEPWVPIAGTFGPFETRREALAFEVERLREALGGIG